MSHAREATREISRRDFIGGAAAVAAGAYAATTGATPARANPAPVRPRRNRKPDSTIRGVRLGINAPYSFHGQFQSVEETLEALIDLGLSWVELRGPGIEQYAGAPAELLAGGGSPEERRERAAALRRWRLSQSMDKYLELRWMYESAGVRIQLVKFPDLTANLDDEEAGYIFEVAKALGAEAITTEPPVSHAKRLGQLATWHRVMVAYHGHTGGDRERFGQDGSWEQTFFYSPFNGASFDIGHYVAGNNASPIPFIKEYAHRIANIHLKDRKMNNGPNVPWGEGDTPVAEVLRLMRDEGYRFQATIEMEHPIPEGSSVMAELRKCVEFVRNALEE